MEAPKVLFSAKVHDEFLCVLQPIGRCVQVMTPLEMMTEMDDPMVLKHGLATRARKKQEGVLKNVVFENSVVDSPTSGTVEVPKLVVWMETTHPALTHSPVDKDMSKPGDGAQSEARQEEDLALPMKPNEGVELALGSSSFSSPKSGNFNANAVEGHAVAQKKRKERGKNWAKMDTDDLLKAVLNTKKLCTQMEQGPASDSYWDAIAKAVSGRTGHECQGRMDTLKRSFSTMKQYCDEQLKEFKQLKEMDFANMKVSPRLTEEWYNQIHDNCPPRPKKKLKTNGAGSSSKNTGFVPDTSTLGLPPPVVPDRIDQGESSLVDSPASQLELPVADPIQQPAPPAAPPCSDFIEDLYEAWLRTLG